MGKAPFHGVHRQTPWPGEGGEEGGGAAGVDGDRRVVEVRRAGEKGPVGAGVEAAEDAGGGRRGVPGGAVSRELPDHGAVGQISEREPGVAAVRAVEQAAVGCGEEAAGNGRVGGEGVDVGEDRGLGLPGGAAVEGA